MKKTIEGFFKTIIIAALITAMTIPAFASEANDPIGRCRAVSTPQVTIIEYNHN